MDMSSNDLTQRFRDADYSDQDLFDALKRANQEREAALLRQRRSAERASKALVSTLQSTTPGTLYDDLEAELEAERQRQSFVAMDEAARFENERYHLGWGRTLKLDHELGSPRH